MSGSSPSSLGSETVARPSALACTACRRKHQKCDAKLPVCSRCTAAGSECNYTPSRRGHKSSTRRHGKLSQSSTRNSASCFQNTEVSRLAPSAITTPASDWPLAESTDFQSSGIYFSPLTSGQPLVEPLQLTSISSCTQPSSKGQSSLLAARPSLNSDTINDDEQLVNLFYSSFHQAHPILVPRNSYHAQSYPRSLRLVVQFIGSHYSSSVSGGGLRDEISREISVDGQRTPSTVQARLLYSIALHARNEVKDAQKMLAMALDLALDLGMNLKQFALNNGRQQPMLEESLRRTWWELYVIDGYMAALYRTSGFRSNKVEKGALLPCEELLYAEGTCLPDPPSLEQFDGRLFADEEIQYSSFCYRIEAVRILGRVVGIAGLHEIHQDQVAAVDYALAAWVHHLPAAKTDIISTYGEVDEMLFQAHMIIQSANIFLHFPRSDLLSTLPATADIACAQRDMHMSPTSTQHTHSIKATEASKELTNLAALRIPVSKHTPFFVCGLVLGAVVQLSACSAHSKHCLEQHRDRVALIVGILKSLSQTWSMSQVVLQQIKKVAADVLQVKRRPDVSQHRSQQDSGIETSLGTDEIPWFETLDIQGLQGLLNFDSESIYSG